MTLFRIVAMLATALTLVSCSGTPAAAVHLQNGTDVPLGIYVNGGWVGTYPAGADTHVPIPGGDPPYVIEARTDGGFVLTRLEVTPEDAAAIDEGRRSLHSTTDAPCGVLRLTVGDAAFEPLPASEMEPGPCPGTTQPQAQANPEEWNDR